MIELIKKSWLLVRGFDLDPCVDYSSGKKVKCYRCCLSVDADEALECRHRRDGRDKCPVTVIPF